MIILQNNQKQILIFVSYSE